MVRATTAAQAQVETDLSRGGRWTSLRLGGREWLWLRDEPRRRYVRPGDGFIDAGGVEECVPTVRGTPDHGAAWSKPWQRAKNAAFVDCGQFLLRRRLHCDGATVNASYRLSARPGFRFLWAAHALLDLSTKATLRLPHGTAMRLYPEATPYLPSGWPHQARHKIGYWPEPCGLPLARLGPDDGSAIGATAIGSRKIDVIDGPEQLRLQLHADATVPTSIALWRNLRGFPPDNPYRSIGVEPMLGTVFDLADAGPEDAVTVPAAGVVNWHLRISAARMPS